MLELLVALRRGEGPHAQVERTLRDAIRRPVACVMAPSAADAEYRFDREPSARCMP